MKKTAFFWERWIFFAKVFQDETLEGGNMVAGSQDLQYVQDKVHFYSVCTQLHHPLYRKPGSS